MTPLDATIETRRPASRQGPKPINRATQALLSEANDLLFLAGQIESCAIRPVPGLEEWKAQAASLLTKVTFGSLGSERALDRLARDLRTLWLRYAQGTTDVLMRSPTAAQQSTVTGAGTPLSFGYERELEPTTLEARCATFTEHPPGWIASHLIFSSGQATLSAVLQGSLQMSLAEAGQPLRLLHLGSYFETQALLELFEASHVVHAGLNEEGLGAALAQLEESEVLLAELAYCNGSLQVLDLPAFARAWRHARRTPSLVIFDTTLSATRFPLDMLLSLMSGPSAPVVVCLRSALKLDQAGLELANAGICSVYVPRGAALALAEFPETLRRIRKLTGSSLGLQDMAALEAPWFLDPVYATRYCDAVFANNRRLALQFAPTGGLFKALSHPALGSDGDPWAEAPFCTLTLNDPAPENYHRLARLIEEEATSRNLAFDPGGSFGFRGHRFEAIVPEVPDSPSFLRVAMGARGGPSVGGIIQLLNELGRCNTLDDFRPSSTAGRKRAPRHPAA